MASTYIPPANKDCLSPQLYLMFVIRKCFEHFGYKASGKFFHNAEMKKLLLYNNYALDFKEMMYYVEANRTTSQGPITGSATIIFNNEITDTHNCYNPSTGQYEIKIGGWHKIVAELVVTHAHTNVNLEVYLVIKKGTTIIAYEFWEGRQSSPFTVKIDKSILFEDTDIGEYVTIAMSVTQIVQPEDEDGVFTVTAANLIVDQISLSNLNQYSKIIDYKNHVPDKKISDFLESIYKTFGIIPFFDHKQKKVELVYFNDLLTHPNCNGFDNDLIKDSIEVEQNDYNGIVFDFERSQNDEFLENKEYDIDDLYASYDTYFDKPDNLDEVEKIVKLLNSNKLLYWKVIQEEQELGGEGSEITVTVFTRRWQFFADDFRKYTLGNADKKITTGFMPLTMSFRANPGISYFPTNTTPYMLIPRVKQVGTSKYFDTGINDPGLRLMIYHGKQRAACEDGSELDKYYPMASFGRRDANGDLITEASLQLDWYGTDGLIATFWQTYINWLQRRRPVNFQKLLTAKDINKMNFSEKKRIQQIMFLLREINLKVDSRKMGVSKITGYSL